MTPVPCEQRFLSCMVFYEVIRVAAWLVCWRSWFVYTGREQINYATNRRSGVLPFLFWRRGKKYEKKTPDYRLIRDRQAKRKT